LNIWHKISGHLLVSGRDIYLKVDDANHRFSMLFGARAIIKWITRDSEAPFHYGNYIVNQKVADFNMVQDGGLPMFANPLDAVAIPPQNSMPIGTPIKRTIKDVRYGDFIRSGFETRKVLAKINDVVIYSLADDFDVASDCFFTIHELIKDGWKIQEDSQK
jgi:hypothetical protein